MYPEWSTVLPPHHGNTIWPQEFATRFFNSVTALMSLHTNSLIYTMFVELIQFFKSYSDGNMYEEDSLPGYIKEWNTPVVKIEVCREKRGNTHLTCPLQLVFLQQLSSHHTICIMHIPKKVYTLQQK